MKIVHSWGQVRLPRRVGFLLGSLLSLFVLYSSTVNYVESGEAGLTYNPFSGQVGIQAHAGWQVNAPWVFVTTIDTRPQRVCLTSTSHAAANCRLIQFNTTHYRDFVRVEGWRWYWFNNRLSFNSGYETYRGWRDVLRGYAFAAQRYPFIDIITEYE